MVRVRLPERLETVALRTWLKALNVAIGYGKGEKAPLMAPPALLATALNQRALGLREDVVARLAAAAVVAGLSRIEVRLEHPTLVQALVETLSEHPCGITCLSLTLGPRTSLNGQFCGLLREMTSLTALTLTPATNDSHLAALAAAFPPLVSLDISYCSKVTDEGVKALLGLSSDTRTILEIVRGSKKAVEPHPIITTLESINIWGTEVTSRGCVLLLSTCTALTSLTCRWVGEALDLILRSRREEHLTLTQLLLAETILPPLDCMAVLCPQMTSLVVRRPAVPLDFNSIMGSIPFLNALTLLQFMPSQDFSLKATQCHCLTYLHLTLLDLREVDLLQVAQSCPELTYLTLEGILPSLPSPHPTPPPSKLECIRLITPLTLNHVIDPRIAVWALVWAVLARSVDLGSCKLVTDQHLTKAITEGALQWVEDMRLSHASQVTDAGINDLLISCPNLRRLALKMLPKERLVELESLKIKLRQENLDIELVTYGWRF